MSQSRRLAAIMFADIVGYTAMMQRNEQEGLAKVRHFSEVIEQQVVAHQGEVLQFMGDGCLCIFHSAVQAMHAAKHIQQSLQDDPQVPLRIGIHIGDIVQQEGNIYGDGVNLASRVESMGVPGSILVTERVIHDVKSHPEFEMKSLGSFQFKNVEKPMEVFALANEGFVVPKKQEMKGKGKPLQRDQAQVPNSSKLIRYVLMALVFLLLLWAGLTVFDKRSPSDITALSTNDKSIAVLPFINLSHDPEQEFFSDGISEDILINLAKIQELKVIARSSSFSFKGQNVPTPEIAEQLKVAHILEGSVRKSGKKLKISTQLVHAESGELLWVENYNRDLEDVFLVQEEVAREIANALSLQLSSEETKELSRATKVDPIAYQKWIEARRLLMGFSLDDYQTAYELLLEAIDIDSTFAEAYVFLGNYYVNRSLWAGDLSTLEAYQLASPHLAKAESLNPGLSDLSRVKGVVDLWLLWDFESAERNFIKSRFEGSNQGIICLLYTYLGDLEKLELALRQLKEIDPFSPDIFEPTALLHYYRNETPQAIEACLTAIRNTPDRSDSYKFLANIYREQGKAGEAIQLLEARLKIIGFRPPNFLAELAVSYAANGDQIKTKDILQELHTYFEKNGKGSPAYYLGMIYANLDDKDKAFEWLEQASKLHEVEMVWLKMDPLARPLHGDSRYEDLLDRVGFPAYEEFVQPNK